MSISRSTFATALMGGLLLSATVSAQATPADATVEPTAKARVRIFGANGQGITMYTNAACYSEYDSKVEVVRSGARAIGSLFGGAPDNITLGIPETDSVRNMKSVLFSKPNYQEYAVEGGQPLIFTARIENTNDYRCDGDLSLHFVAQPGQDYEVQMSLAGGRCLFNARQVRSDGTSRPQPTRLVPRECPVADEEAAVTTDPESDLDVPTASPAAE